MTVGRTSPDAVAEARPHRRPQGEIYAGLARIRDRYADLVREKFPAFRAASPATTSTSCLPENGFQVARALVGSEGTCANGGLSARSTSRRARRFACSRCSDSPMRFWPPMPFRWRWNTGPSASKDSITCSSNSCAAKASPSRNSISCRQAWAFCWWRWAHGAPRKRRSKAEALARDCAKLARPADRAYLHA